MIEALSRAGGHPRHTEYAGVGHDVFMWAYTEPALIDWVFARGGRPVPLTNAPSRAHGCAGAAHDLPRGVRTRSGRGISDQENQ
jgi:hypothetical protein